MGVRSFGSLLSSTPIAIARGEKREEKGTIDRQEDGRLFIFGDDCMSQLHTLPFL